ncbi:hypothetical protein C8F01DRAFT_1090388 [Mycena amicta]|nr:hypothetical protein C8F01DRAFT_1090388 [Mycena amicta]
MLLRVDGYPRTTPPSLSRSPRTRREPDLFGPSTCSRVLINGKGIVAVYSEGHDQFGPGKNGKREYSGVAGCTGVDDVPFTQELLSHLSDNLCLDSNSFHASGKSNRGGFTNLLACTPTSSLPLRLSHLHFTPVPTLQLRTISDRIVPFGGQDADKEGERRMRRTTSHNCVKRGQNGMGRVWGYSRRHRETILRYQAQELDSDYFGHGPPVQHTSINSYQRWFPETTSAKEGEAYFSKRVSSVHGSGGTSLDLSAASRRIHYAYGRPSVPPTFFDAGAEFAQAMPLAFFDGGGLLFEFSSRHWQYSQSVV